MSTITPAPAPTPANWVGYLRSNTDYLPSYCDTNSIWSTTGSMGRCCAVNTQCYFYKSCDGNTAVEAASNARVACQGSSMCATETIYNAWPDVSPFSHVICVPPGYTPSTAFRQLAASATSSSGSSKATDSSSDTASSTSKAAEPTAAPVASPASSASGSNKAVAIGAAIGAVILVIILAALVGVVIYLKKRVSALAEKGDNSGTTARGAEDTAFTPGDHATYPLTKPFAYQSSPYLHGTAGNMSVHSFQTTDQTPVLQTPPPVHQVAPVELSAVPHHQEAWELPERNSIRSSKHSATVAQINSALQASRSVPSSTQQTPVQSPVQSPVSRKATPVISPISNPPTAGASES